MKRTMTVVVATMLALAGASFAQAEPGPNGNNDHGLCTAYFNGQKNGHDGGSPPPFKALEDAAEPEDDNEDGTTSSEEVAAAVYEFCQTAGIGGNEDHGRWDCVLDDQDEATCTEDNTPGGGNGGGNRGGNRGGGGGGD